MTDALEQIKYSLDLEYHATITDLAANRAVSKEQTARAMSFRGIETFNSDLAREKKISAGQILMSQAEAHRLEILLLEKRCQELLAQKSEIEGKHKAELLPIMEKLASLRHEQSLVNFSYDTKEAEGRKLLRQFALAEKPTEFIICR
jgi:hypothetical protein